MVKQAIDVDLLPPGFRYSRALELGFEMMEGEATKCASSIHKAFRDNMNADKQKGLESASFSEHNIL